MSVESKLGIRPWRWSFRARIMWALIRGDANALPAAMDHILESHRVQNSDLLGARKALDRFDALSTAAAQVRSVEGVAMEFGVFEGVTLRHLAKEIGPNRPLIGFDTFEGLPSNWGDLLTKGTFATAVPSLKGLANVRLEIGRIEETLPKFLAEHPQPIALVHIDCPYYAINVFILEHVLPHMAPHGTVIFDEYYGYPSYQEHEFKAWADIRARFDLHAVPIAYSSRSAAFRVDQPPSKTSRPSS